ncbi:MAG: guanylate kinase [Bacilli bacterium]|nr:guanylate kinase [Bacilli bacterium]
MKKGLLIILSGPSGVGKGTVRKYISAKNVIDFEFSISMTTRTPRDNESDGVEYYFVSREEFQKRIEEDKFLEYAEFVGNFYGTPKDKVEELRNQGKNVLLEIETNGATQVIEKTKGDDRVVTFYLMPPSIKKLEERIRARKSESDDVIKMRLAKGENEMKVASMYDHVIVNDRVATAGNKIIDILKKKMEE